MKDDRVYLDHILECLEWIARYCGEGQQAFFADRKAQSATLRELAIAGFRNVLVHDYLGIKLERVWAIVERDLPVLRSAVEAMRQQMYDENR